MAEPGHRLRARFLQEFSLFRPGQRLLVRQTMRPMSHEDFDINGLATYLHLTRDQVLKLVERGKLPGRRIAGQWRFARAEVHHWWEERIGSSGAAELAQVETVLQRTRTTGWRGHLARGIVAGRGDCDSTRRPHTQFRHHRHGGTRRTNGQTCGTLPGWKRRFEHEKTCTPRRSTTVWLSLHPRRPLGAILAEPFLALGITSQGIPFSGSRMLTDVFFLICSTEDRWHLRTLARLSRLLADDSFLQQLRGLTDPRRCATLADGVRNEPVGPVIGATAGGFRHDDSGRRFSAGRIRQDDDAARRRNRSRRQLRVHQLEDDRTRLGV